MYRRDLDLPRLPSFVEKVVSARYGLPNMMLEDADHPARCPYSFVEEIRGNSLNRIPQVQKLRSSFGGLKREIGSQLRSQFHQDDVRKSAFG
jgi:hypothetical protein